MEVRKEIKLEKVIKNISFVIKLISIGFESKTFVFHNAKANIRRLMKKINK